MPDLMTSIDHLVVAALTLEDGVNHVRQALGVEMPFGGKHPLMATHNHLMRVGEGIFLEIIAPDPVAVPQRRRWFGLDDARFLEQLRNSPRLLTWVIRSKNLAATLQQVDGIAGEPIAVSRGALSWQIAVPHDGSMAFEGAFPTLIEWPHGPHPSLQMADLGCRLDHFRIEHPESALLAKALEPIFADDRVEIAAGNEVKMSASFTTPAGVRRLT